MSGPTVTARPPHRRPTTRPTPRPATVMLCLALGVLPLTSGLAAPSARPARGSAAAIQPAHATPLARHALARADAQPLTFEPNRGQTDSRVRYLARGRGYTLFLTGAGAVLTLTQPSGRPCAKPTLHGALHPSLRPTRANLSRSVACHALSSAGGGRGDMGKTTSSVLRLTFPGARAHPALTPRDRLSGAVSYLRGRDPRGWLAGLPTYARVAYHDLYPGVDAVYYGRDGQLEYDLTLAPGADPRAPRLRFDGGTLRLDRSGDLLIALAGGTLRQRAPVVYQLVGATRRSVQGRYALLDAHTVGIRLGAYDHRAPLVIDPALGYSTYLGGNADDYGFGIAVDRAGNAYVAGYTGSANFPTANAARGSFGGGATDAFVTKLNPAGNGLAYSTYLGGSGDDFGLGIAVNAAGNAYVTGYTNSGDFPIANPAQGSLNSLGGSAFVAELNPAGNGLVYSTYLGGGVFDVGNAIAVDSSGAAYVTGVTASSDFPTASPLQGSLNGSTNAFVSKLNPAGNGLVYSTFLGGSGDVDQGNGIAVDASGAAYVTGVTNSRDFPTANALQGAYSGVIENAFVSKLNPAGNGLAYSTFLGGAADDQGNAIAVDSNGAAYVAGQTSSPNFPTANALQSAYAGATDAFVSKLNPAGNGLVYSTFLGGSGDDQTNGIAVDINGNAYVAGQTSSPNFPTANAAQSTPGGSDDAFAFSLNAGGNGLVYSTYIGGSGSDIGRAVALDTGGNAYVTGYTISPNFPTANPLQGSFNGGSYDAFVTKIGNAPIPAVPPTPVPSSTPAPPTVTPAPGAATATPIAPTATITVTPAATITATRPITTPTRVPVPVPGASSCAGASALPLTLVVSSRGAVGAGGTLIFAARTGRGARITATLQVTAQRPFYVGTGKKRKRILHTVLLYGTATGGASDSRGLFTGRLHVTYRPSSPTRAQLNVTASQPCGRANRVSTVTILPPPPPLTASAARGVRADRILTVTLRTTRGAKVAATLQVTVRRAVTIGKGKKATRATRTVTLYSVGAHGTADKRGLFTGRLHVTYKVKRPVQALLTATSTLSGVTATRTQNVTIQP